METVDSVYTGIISDNFVLEDFSSKLNKISLRTQLT
jgi:hypothetical protein